MSDLLTLCVLGFIVIIGLVVVMNMMRGMGRGGNYPEEGYRPEYDDPDVQSRGGFGRNRRGLGGFGGFGSGRSGGFGGTETPKSGGRSSGFGGSSGGRADSPNVKSRGGFGRNKR
ncbi:MAG: hypothetical protein SF162_12750 [bacterium]|nr:hypothetical protein [bacterium]